MLLIAILINMAIVSAAVIIHYEMLRLLSLNITKMTIKHRLRVLSGIFGALVAHIFEIWLFAFGYFLMSKVQGLGTLQGNYDGSLIDSVYFSITTYTSLGFGDVVPLGHIRFLAGLEALTGLVLITWTASFMFIEMQKFWRSLK